MKEIRSNLSCYLFGYALNPSSLQPGSQGSVNAEIGPMPRSDAQHLEKEHQGFQQEHTASWMSQETSMQNATNA